MNLQSQRKWGADLRKPRGEQRTAQLQFRYANAMGEESELADAHQAGGEDGALIVLAMTLGYTSMDRVLLRKNRAAMTKYLCGGPTGLPIAKLSLKHNQTKSRDQ